MKRFQEYDNLLIDNGTIPFTFIGIEKGLQLYSTQEERVRYLESVIISIKQKLFDEKKMLNTGLIRVFNAATKQYAYRAKIDTDENVLEYFEKLLIDVEKLKNNIT